MGGGSNSSHCSCATNLVVLAAGIDWVVSFSNIDESSELMLSIISPQIPLMKHQLLPPTSDVPVCSLTGE